MLFSAFKIFAAHQLRVKSARLKVLPRDVIIWLGIIMSTYIFSEQIVNIISDSFQKSSGYQLHFQSSLRLLRGSSIFTLFLGVKKIPEIARSFGRAKTEYEKSKIEAKRELQKIESDSSLGNSSEEREKLESIADTLGIDHTQRSIEELRTLIKLELEKDKRQTEV
jgi:sec-independent protein translocase protein TatA